MKTIIKKSELKSIYDIVCPTWKPVIEKYAQRNPFDIEVEFSEQEIHQMIAACTKEQLPIVKSIFEVVETHKELKTIKDCINKLTEEDEEIIQLRKLESIKDLSEHILNNQIAVVIIKALNDGWIPDWNDSNQYKYYPWFCLGEDFRYNFFYRYYTHAAVSSRLCLKSKELAIYAGQQFGEIYKKFIN